MRSAAFASASFQVVPPCGGHRKAIEASGGAVTVSSRAPVWGASIVSPRARRSTSTFQVVPPCGGHLTVDRKSMDADRFQVVPPCGGHPCVIYATV